MREHAVAVTLATASEVYRHVLRADRQEDLCFALYRPFEGGVRWTASIVELVLPQEGEREVHGNVAFHSAYIRRALRVAGARGLGLALIHSHPLGAGWQGMSRDDVAAETGHGRVVLAETGLPLVGITIAGDRAWSARVWWTDRRRKPQRVDCQLVRVSGTRLACTLHPKAVGRESPLHARTVSFWGASSQRAFADIRIGIVGLGSVGSIVAESLARMGARRLTLIDHDTLEPHNLDRTIGARRGDLGDQKVRVAARNVRIAATAEDLKVTAVPCRVNDEPGLKALLDCDVAFSCVDRPVARHTMNRAAFTNFIPVIDGGILVRFAPQSGKFQGADWAVHSAAPGRACLLCRGAYDLGDVSLELTGLLDDPTYVRGLPAGSSLRARENVFPLSAAVASFEVLQLISMISGLMNLYDLQQQRYSYYPGVVRVTEMNTCRPECPFPALQYA